MLLQSLLVLFLAIQSGGVLEQSTATFRVRHERGLSQEDAKFLAGLFEETYAGYREEYDITLGRKVEVRVLNSPARMKIEARTPAYTKAVVKNGKIYLLAASPIRDRDDIHDLVRRSVMMVMWEEVQTCPRWLAAAFSVYAGNAVEEFGQPAAVDVYTFEDLSEEYLRADSEKEIREVYAKLATAADYLVRRFGEKKFKAFIMEFRKSGITIDEALTAAFGEKQSDIERGLVRAFRSGRSK
jgi:hypothetical protein